MKKQVVAADAKIVTAFGRFAASGYKKSLLTKPLYLALSRCFGFIAHFDRDGFYEARFGGPAARVATFAVIMGEQQAALTMTELEKRLRTMVHARGLVDAAKKEFAAETDRTERAELARLKVKYESRSS